MLVMLFPTHALLVDFLLVRAFRLERLVGHRQEHNEAENDDINHQHTHTVPLGLATPAKEVQKAGILGIGDAWEGQQRKGFGVVVVDFDESGLHDPAEHADTGHPGTEPDGERACLEDQPRGDKLYRGDDADGDVSSLCVIESKKESEYISSN